jgi:hypothetical protein
MLFCKRESQQIISYFNLTKVAFPVKIKINPIDTFLSRKCNHYSSTLFRFSFAKEMNTTMMKYHITFRSLNEGKCDKIHNTVIRQSLLSIRFSKLTLKAKM